MYKANPKRSDMVTVLSLAVGRSRTLKQLIHMHSSPFHKALMVSRVLLLQGVPELSYVLHAHHWLCKAANQVQLYRATQAWNKKVLDLDQNKFLFWKWTKPFLSARSLWLTHNICNNEPCTSNRFKKLASHLSSQQWLILPCVVSRDVLKISALRGAVPTNIKRLQHKLNCFGFF